MANKTLVSIAEADSVGGHVGGFSQVVAAPDTTTYAIDFSAWQHRYVKLVFQGEVFYYCWGNASDLPNIATFLIAGNATTPPPEGTDGTRGVADIGFAPSAVFEVPSQENSTLFFTKAASANAGQITVLPK